MAISPAHRLEAAAASGWGSRFAASQPLLNIVRLGQVASKRDQREQAVPDCDTVVSSR